MDMHCLLIVVQLLICVQISATSIEMFFCPSSSPGACSNLCLLSQWCHPTISSSVIPFSACPQSFSASGSFPVSWLFTKDGQSIGASASASVLPINIQGWFPLGVTGLISLQSKGPSRVFSSTTVQKHQFLALSLLYGFSSSHVWMWELDHKEGWAPKNWWFWTVVLQKTPESPLDSKEIKPVNRKGNQSSVFIGRIDANAEAPILWPPNVKN